MSSYDKGVAMRNLFKYGGIAASVVLIAFGAGSIGIGAWGINNVRDNLALEQISGTPDMTPSAIKAEAQKAGLTDVSLPSCNVAGKSIDTGSEARCFASYMRIHALEATGGQPYALMGRFLDSKGNPTSDEAKAAKDPKTGQPVENGKRNLWVTATALTTALNMAYFGERVGVFGIVMGIALLLTGIGFLVLTLGGALERKPVTETAKHPVAATN
ncbi:MAG: hypothetical protein E6G45_08545 [Actinobacteria bacterium]|nr:MAG: hypothetical protein E6G45_08545 [Actinomycetota bacterium]